MTQEDKELLLKDLCTRLQYGVKIQVNDKIESLEGINVLDNAVEYGSFLSSEIEEVKPYLFPLSNMTDEEWEDYQKIRMIDWVHGDINGTFINASLIVDWLNRNHFDYRGLIEKGLAIDATNLNIYTDL